MAVSTDSSRFGKNSPKDQWIRLAPMTTAAAEERDEEQRRGHTHGRNLERKRAKIKKEKKRKEKKRKEKKINASAWTRTLSRTKLIFISTKKKGRINEHHPDFARYHQPYY